MTIIDAGGVDLGLFVRAAIVGLEGAGTAVIVIGAMIAGVRFGRGLVRDGFEAAYRSFRAILGRTILMGLELLVAADILRSLVMPHELENLLGLAVLMFARTFLSLSLNVEINGHWPWHERRIGRDDAATVQP